jgi:heavy metal translocating P-type ATPase
LGVLTAFFYSVYLSVFSRQALLNVSPHNYYDAASAIVLFLLAGRILENKAHEKSKSSLKNLFELLPEKVTVLKSNNKELTVKRNEIRIGDRIRVKPGEKIPTDAQVLEGTSYVDESLITGESLPVLKAPKDFVTGGTVNHEGHLIIEASKKQNDIYLSQMIKLLKDAQLMKAPIQKTVDKVSKFFIPIVIFISLLTLGFWSYFGTLDKAIFHCVSVLIISCPCALGLATPTAITVAVGRGGQKGILIKTPPILEKLKKAQIICFDKTGTVTNGLLEIKEIFLVENSYFTSKKELIQSCASLESVSEHPVAKAVLKRAKNMGITLLAPKNFKNTLGKGVEGQVNNLRLSIGNKKHIEEQGLEIEKHKNLLDFYEKEINKGFGVFFASAGDELVGAFSLEDRVREHAFRAIKDLKKLKITPCLLSGDNYKTVSRVAKKLGIEKFYGECSPEKKSMIIKEFQKKNNTVIMAGDGINDAPALSIADIGISLKSGTDMAKESADIILLNNDISIIVEALNLGEKTLKTIKENLFFAFVYNALCIPLAAGVFYPFFGLTLSPVFGSLAMSLSSISVVLNALKLKNA